MNPSLSRDGDMLTMKGEFTFDTIVPVAASWQQLKQQQLTMSSFVVNCELVTKADSSFFALLIEMRRWAEQQQLKWELKNLPKSLEGFLSAYGIGKLLASKN